MPSHFKEPIPIEELSEENKGLWMPLTDKDIEVMFHDQNLLPKEYDFDNLGDSADEVLEPFMNIETTQISEEKAVHPPEPQSPSRESPP